MCIIIICFPVAGVISFETKLTFLIKSFFLHGQKSQGKKKNILRTKRVFTVEPKAFFIIYKLLL